MQTWRAREREFNESVEAIREGLEDVAAGRTMSLKQFDREFRERHNIPADRE